MLLLKCGLVTLWTTDSQQYVLKSCTIAKRVFYPGTRTLFFVLLVLYQKHFLLLLTCFLNFVLAT